MPQIRRHPSTWDEILARNAIQKPFTTNTEALQPSAKALEIMLFRMTIISTMPSVDDSATTSATMVKPIVT